VALQRPDLGVSYSSKLESGERLIAVVKKILLLFFAALREFASHCRTFSKGFYNVNLSENRCPARRQLPTGPFRSTGSIGGNAVYRIPPAGGQRGDP
jgi:hypothetical protein